MARKKAPEKAPNHERWLVSYADFITLLFAVFVTLYAMSQTDKQKVEEVAASYRDAFGITVGPPPGKMDLLRNTDMMMLPTEGKQTPRSAEEHETDDISDALQEQSSGHRELLATLEERIGGSTKDKDNVDVGMTRKGLIISLKEAEMFDSCSATIKAESYQLLERIADILQPYNTYLSFEGHTDDTQIHTSEFKSNWELSVARATSVAEYFINRKDFSPERISISGFGQYHPVADNRTETGKKRNRRVDIVLKDFAGEISNLSP